MTLQISKGSGDCTRYSVVLDKTQGPLGIRIRKSNDGEGCGLLVDNLIL